MTAVQDTRERLKDFLNSKVEQYNQPSFINADPISVPHLFKLKQDIEIAALFAAIFAWGNRTTIILKCRELMQRMDMAPYDFVRNAGESSLRQLASFKHRTFNETDLLYFVEFLQHHYTSHDSLEDAFLKFADPSNATAEQALNGFYRYFFSLEHIPNRTKKHIASPEKASTCKRLNMFLRWMVRSDDKGVDFGLWTRMSPSQLICPIDLHVARVARRFNLITRKQLDWQTAVELTEYLKTLDAADPVKYDFALFALGVVERF